MNDPFFQTQSWKIGFLLLKLNLHNPTGSVRIHSIICESAELQETGFFSSHDRIEVSLELNCQLLYCIEYKQDLFLLPHSLIVKDDILDGEFYKLNNFNGYLWMECC